MTSTPVAGLPPVMGDWQPLPTLPNPAAEARAEADALLAEANRQHQAAQIKADGIVSAARSEAERLAEEAGRTRGRVLADAREEADRIRSAAEEDAAAAEAARAEVAEKADATARRSAAIDRWSPRVALAATIGLTASGEMELARLAGWPKELAWLLPVAIDIYVVQALRRHRDVYIAIALMVAANATYHLAHATGVGMHQTAEGLAPTWQLVVGVAAIAPLVMWRIHALTAPPREPRKSRRERRRETSGESAVAPAAAGETAPRETPVETVPMPREAPVVAPVETGGESAPAAPSHAVSPAPRAARPKASHRRVSPAGGTRRRTVTAKAAGGSAEKETATLIALIRERGGDPQAVTLTDAKRIVSSTAQATAARRLKAARETYEQTH